jgi:hypothetical protein
MTGGWLLRYFPTLGPVQRFYVWIERRDEAEEVLRASLGLAEDAPIDGVKVPVQALEAMRSLRGIQPGALLPYIPPVPKYPATI